MDPGILRLIAITDGMQKGSAALIRQAVEAEQGGATCIQLRLKEASARDLAEIARKLLEVLSVPLIINDRADVAVAVGAAGCHLGSDDVPVKAIREIVPDGFIIGCSVGSDSEIAGAAGADYAGIGPVFSTATKSDAGKAIGVDGFKRLAEKLSIPVVGIGGITPGNAPQIIAAGAAGIAAVSAIFGAHDVRSASASLARAIEK